MIFALNLKHPYRTPDIGAAQPVFIVRPIDATCKIKMNKSDIPDPKVLPRKPAQQASESHLDKLISLNPAVSSPTFQSHCGIVVFKRFDHQVPKYDIGLQMSRVAIQLEKRFPARDPLQ